jgi:hypothetical protein
MKFPLILILLLTIIFTQCKNDFEVNENWQDITVVYGLLNSKDSIHYIRVNKAFLGDQDAFVMAQVSDSIYYKNITVTLEEWVNSSLSRTIALQKDTTLPKDPGIFASNNNIIYKTNAILNPSAIYKLVILENGKEITSETTLLQDFSILNLPGQASLYTSTGGLNIKWRTAPEEKLYEVSVWFYYYEITATDTIKDSLEIKLPGQTSPSLAGGVELETELKGIEFLSNVGLKIHQNTNVIKRVVAQKSIGIHFMVGSDDMYTYMQVNAPATGIVSEKPAFSNINNGIGLFSSRFSKNTVPLKVNSSTLNTLDTSSYTRLLNFQNNTETSVLWNNSVFNFP